MVKPGSETWPNPCIIININLFKVDQLHIYSKKKYIYLATKHFDS